LSMSVKQLLGNRIKQLRTGCNLTQDALAELVDLNPKYLSNIERGKENPTLDTLLRIGDALGVEPKEMFVFNENLSVDELKKRIANLLEQSSHEQLKTITTLLQTVLH